MRFTLAELDATPPGWAEELSLALAGMRAAEVVVAKRERRKLRPGSQGPDGSQPVYGMPGRRFTPGGGFR